MKKEKLLSKEELKDRAISFFSRYNEQIEQIKDLLKIRLSQICLTYTLQNNLPQEALLVSTRIKKLDSFLKKLERKKWPQFYYPTEIINDLIGARIICWFLTDCDGILNAIKMSDHFETVESSLEDYINNPKSSGYRALHILVNVSYNNIYAERIALIPGKMICEIQIRTRLQDAWGDITHDLYYRSKNSQQDYKKYHDLLSGISNKLLQEDIVLLKLKKIYQETGIAADKNDST